MNSARHWRRRRLRAVSEIIATILLLAITIVAGTILWTFHVYTPPPPPTVAFDIPGGGSNPVWGDPTDCQPLGSWTYPLAASLDNQWGQAWWNECEYFSEDEYPTPGNFSSLNTTQIIFTQISNNHMALSDLNFTFVCNGNYAPAPYTTTTTTVLLTGTLSQMTWFPGLSGEAPAGPYLGYCGGFDMGAEAGVAYGSLFTRLGIFDPLSNATNYLVNGDAFIVYIHNGGYPLDYACIEASGHYAQPWANDNAICPSSGTYPNGITGGPLLDVDDYHGAPPWCFEDPLACTIDISYTGAPNTLLLSIPVYDLTPPT
ncbi:MAG: archaellin/type IV pilin N-terminal domain-containing protein [Thermoplasmata archaeon]